MPQFTQHSPTSSGSPGLRLVRTPHAKPLYAIVTTTTLIGCPTHFANRRTVPCERPQCKLCDEGISWRWHAYVSCYVVENKEHIIFECTANAADAFHEYQDAHGTLRGCHFKAWRVNQAPNGRVVINTQAADLGKYRLPPPPDIPAIMSHIWGLSSAGATTQPSRPGRARILPGADGNGDGENTKRRAHSPDGVEHPG